MNKNEMLTAVAAKAGTTKTQVDTVLKAFEEVIVDTVRDNEDFIAFGKLGRFQPKKADERQARNPFNGETMTVRGYKSLAFRVAPSVKAYVETAKKGKKK